MYQVNYLPWRHNLFRKRIVIWTYQTLIFITITLIICGYYTYHLAQKRNTVSALHTQTQQQEKSLFEQLNIYQQQKEQTDLCSQRYSLYYKNWLRYLHYIRFFQAIEVYLPAAVWISHYSDTDNRHSLDLILPKTQSLSFITHFKHHPILTTLSLDHLQQSKISPSYTEVHLTGKWEIGEPWNKKDVEEVP
ncbi:fimbrial assembly protein [Proteus vulgaris]|uniref:fimbrial assembly protein n=1 Tax=Proteus sp. fly-1008 TaxID=3136672 RepID=UPI0030F65B5A